MGLDIGQSISFGLYDAGLCEIGDLGRREAEPAAVDAAVVLAELGFGVVATLSAP
jgi:hypothetical protein